MEMGIRRKNIMKKKKMMIKMMGVRKQKIKAIKSRREEKN